MREVAGARAHRMRTTGSGIHRSRLNRTCLGDVHCCSRGARLFLMSSGDAVGHVADAMRCDGHDEDGGSRQCCTAAETRTLQRAEAKIHEEPGPTFRKLTAARYSASRRFRALEAKQTQENNKVGIYAR